MSPKKQYLVYALDHTDAEAPQRRQAARAAHLAQASTAKKEQRLVSAGAMLSSDTEPNAKMIGSVLVFQAESEAQVREWIQSDPYIAGNVWGQISVHLFFPANL